MKRIYLHIGYHKTATTFLQHAIYPEMRNVTYINKEYIREDFRRVRLKKLSDSEIKQIRDYINSFHEGKPLLISNEALSGSPFAPRKTKTQAKILQDLRRIFPASDYDVRIIVGIREQVELLTSLFVQHLHQGGVRNGPEYIKHLEQTGSLENFHFHNYLREIEKIFGDDRVYVMVYEHFKENFSVEMLKLLNYMSEPEIPPYQNKGRNKSFGKLQVAIARRLNRLFKTPIHPEGRLPIINVPIIGPLSPRRFLQNRYSFALHYEKYQFPEALQVSLRQRYAEGNQKLAGRYNLNLPDTYTTKRPIK